MAFIVQGIDHVQVAAPAGCEEKAREFYGEIMGLQEIEKPDELKKRGGCWFKCGNQEIHIGVEAHFTPAKKAHPAFLVKHIEEFQQVLTKKGVSVLEDKACPGVTRFYVCDPFGNRIEFMENNR
ncbi:VOC family protein [Bacillus manliponensis]|uniref:VOC family protein n=1 Tax=Bacillus manliponensis TaxID=574376 RepID=UPI003511B71D